MTSLSVPTPSAYPGAGTLRVHPEPEWLAPPDPELPGENRFDDPAGRVAVRYTATRLTGALYETLARFRPAPEAEALLESIDGVDEQDVEHFPDDVEALATWLARQRVGTVRVLDAGDFVDIEDPSVLVALDKHPDVRAALEVLDPAARLDMGFARLGGLRLGRPDYAGGRHRSTRMDATSTRDRVHVTSRARAVLGDLVVDSRGRRHDGALGARRNSSPRGPGSGGCLRDLAAERVG